MIILKMKTYYLGYLHFWIALLDFLFLYILIHKYIQLMYTNSMKSYNSKCCARDN